MKEDSTQRAQDAEASPFIISSPKSRRRLQPTIMVGDAVGDTVENGRRT